VKQKFVADSAIFEAIGRRMVYQVNTNGYKGWRAYAWANNSRHLLRMLLLSPLATERIRKCSKFVNMRIKILCEIVVSLCLRGYKRKIFVK
jgi:hypothetical protein